MNDTVNQEPVEIKTSVEAPTTEEIAEHFTIPPDVLKLADQVKNADLTVDCTEVQPDTTPLPDNLAFSIVHPVCLRILEDEKQAIQNIPAVVLRDMLLNEDPDSRRHRIGRALMFPTQTCMATRLQYGNAPYWDTVMGWPIRHAFDVIQILLKEESHRKLRNAAAQFPILRKHFMDIGFQMGIRHINPKILDKEVEQVFSSWAKPAKLENLQHNVLVGTPTKLMFQLTQDQCALAGKRWFKHMKCEFPTIAELQARVEAEELKKHIKKQAAKGLNQ